MKPSELIGYNYCGPSRVIDLAQIRNDDGFRFIGIDKLGEKHFCIVRYKDGSYVMHSNTVAFDELIGWIPDMRGGVLENLPMREGDCNADALPSEAQRTLMAPETSNRITKERK